MCNMKLNRVKKLVLAAVILVTLHIFGVFTHFFEKDFNKGFAYPYDGDIHVFVEQLRNNRTPDVAPINKYNYEFLKNPKNKCGSIEQIKLVYLVKSQRSNFVQRNVIRTTWGYERRFSDVDVRTVFLLGNGDDNLEETIKEEFKKYADIVQADFVDSYFNNTIKTMVGFKWAVNYCNNAQFYMFVDDDYYISTKNVLRYVRNPTNYPQYIKNSEHYLKLKMERRKLQDIFDYELPNDIRLYSGFVFSSYPLRHRTSKWYVSLEEYPYDRWPPYVTAGAYVLSREALIDMFYTSYYTKHFRFDDVYVGILALKAKIEPFHSEHFHFYKQKYNKKDYEFTVASHGYSDINELMKVWNEQKSLGNA